MIVAGWLIVAALTIGSRDDKFQAGVLFGTIFGNITIAAAWIALGPGPLVMRLALSPLWVMVLYFPLVVDITTPFDTDSFGGFHFFTIFFFGQWLIVQIAIWSVVFAFGWRITYRGIAPSTSAARQGNRASKVVN